MHKSDNIYIQMKSQFRNCQMKSNHTIFGLLGFRITGSNYRCSTDLDPNSFPLICRVTDTYRRLHQVKPFLMTLICSYRLNRLIKSLVLNSHPENTYTANWPFKRVTPWVMPPIHKSHKTTIMIQRHLPLVPTGTGNCWGPDDLKL